MSEDDEKGPVFRRARSQQDRDRYVSKVSPVRGVPIFAEEECTGRYEGEELQLMRSRQPTDKRISKLETKHDELVKVVGETRVDVAKMSGQMDTLVALAEAREQRWKHWPAIIKALGIAIATIIVAYMTRRVIG